VRDFVGADDLSFTPEEQAGIARAAGQQLPMDAPLLPHPNRRSWLLAASGIATLLWWLAPADVFHGAASTQTPSGSGLTVALARRTVHLREGPSVSARSLGVMPTGSLMAVAEQRADGFDQVQYGNMQGYAAAVYLAISDGVELLPQVGTRIGQVTGSVRVREQASLSAMSIAGLSTYAPVTVLGFTPRGWCLVSTGTRAGFVWGGFLEDQPSLPFRTRQEGATRAVEYRGEVLRP